MSKFNVPSHTFKFQGYVNVAPYFDPGMYLVVVSSRHSISFWEVILPRVIINQLLKHNWIRLAQVLKVSFKWKIK